MEYNTGDIVRVEDNDGNKRIGNVIDTESHRSKQMVEVETDHGTEWFFDEEVGEVEEGLVETPPNAVALPYGRTPEHARAFHRARERGDA